MDKNKDNCVYYIKGKFGKELAGPFTTLSLARYVIKHRIADHVNVKDPEGYDILEIEGKII